ncbi:hypothetical protein [Streptomyces sp. BR123]|nr:hypothetical protein [Streptomyces sp. BR123]
MGQGTFQQLMEAVIAEAAARGETDMGLVSVDPRRPGPTTTPPG